MSSIITEITTESQRRATEEILDIMTPHLDGSQMMELNKVLNNEFSRIQLTPIKEPIHENWDEENQWMVKDFFKAKKIEGLSDRTLEAYKNVYNHFFKFIDKHYTLVDTEDIREYLTYYQELNGCSLNTLDTHRRYLLTLFTWLTENEYILHNPMKRIGKIKTPIRVKKEFSNMDLEKMRDAIPERDLRTRAVFELLLSSGIRVGELYRLNRDDLNFHTLTFKVLGKGSKERLCYFNETASYYLKKYLKSRKDNNPALFVTKAKPHNRVGTNGHERIIRELGVKAGVENAHPHRFRRTTATLAVKRGMPIEEVQKLLGHSNISTTMLYVNVDQDTVKLNHSKFTN